MPGLAISAACRERNTFAFRQSETVNRARSRATNTPSESRSRFTLGSFRKGLARGTPATWRRLTELVVVESGDSRREYLSGRLDNASPAQRRCEAERPHLGPGGQQVSGPINYRKLPHREDQHGTGPWDVKYRKTNGLTMSDRTHARTHTPNTPQNTAGAAGDFIQTTSQAAAFLQTPDAAARGSGTPVASRYGPRRTAGQSQAGWRRVLAWGGDHSSKSVYERQGRGWPDEISVMDQAARQPPPTPTNPTTLSADSACPL
ncbi:hypothetical protein P4O66_016344 [Electrophorus voltai]|uniref:Uncharacterized protein n=1 Tax=Electrophorus voltai TaxID=2609070 RepID=A0AAD8YY52_9TELE|nr:hypothetical protein P4O66_016344 [Electrophorus voltai]